MQLDTQVAETVAATPTAEPALVRPLVWYAPFKMLLDTLLAAVLLVLFSPLILLLMLLVKCTSPGPALYSQVRLGLGRRPFTLYKIRSMRHDCERHTGPRWASTDDPRVTSLGKFLRKSHLDELPQLWNVLRGEMSLVGPRPERPEFVEQLERVLPEYQYRLLVRPGVTGLAQVQLPPDIDLTSVRRKVTCDLYYIHNMNPVMDLQIILATATKVFGVPCEVSCEALRIPTEATIRAARALSSQDPGTDSRCVAELA